MYTKEPSQVFAGDLDARHWCIDSGVLEEVSDRRHHRAASTHRRTPSTPHPIHLVILNTITQTPSRTNRPMLGQEEVRDVCELRHQLLEPCSVSHCVLGHRVMQKSEIRRPNCRGPIPRKEEQHVDIMVQRDPNLSEVAPTCTRCPQRPKQTCINSHPQALCCV